MNEISYLFCNFIFFLLIFRGIIFLSNAVIDDFVHAHINLLCECVFVEHFIHMQTQLFCFSHLQPCLHQCLVHCTTYDGGLVNKVCLENIERKMQNAQYAYGIVNFSKQIHRLNEIQKFFPMLKKNTQKSMEKTNKSDNNNDSRQRIIFERQKILNYAFRCAFRTPIDKSLVQTFASPSFTHNVSLDF